MFSSPRLVFSGDLFLNRGGLGSRRVDLEETLVFV
jgi:hypothetical protein